MTNLKLLRQHKYITTILIIITCILPNMTELFLKSIPTFQERQTRRWFPALDPAYKLLNAFEGDWVLYDFIVIYKSSRGEMDERRKDCLIPVPEYQHTQASQDSPTYSASV